MSGYQIGSDTEALRCTAMRAHRIRGQPDQCGSRIVRIDRNRCHHETREAAIEFARNLGPMWCDPCVMTQESDGRLFVVEKVEQLA